jgi:endo-1,4-beta-xylanase
MTIWGVTDKHSWLQTSNSAGGGANGNARQYPLLFDDYYKAKNAFWAIADAGELEPEIKNLTLIQNAADDFEAGESYKFGDEETSVSFVPMWKDGEIDVKVTVADATVDATDAFVVYTDDGAELKATEVKRSNAQATDAGYTEVVKISVDAQALSTNKVKFDLVAVNGEKKVAFGDTTFNQEQSSKYFAETVIKPLLSVAKGTVTVDGEGSDAAWAEVKEFPLSINLGADVTANAKVLWDEEKLYVLVDVKDEVLNKDSSDAWQQDSVEFFIDENNAKSSSYQEDDKQYRVNYENTHSFNGTKCLEENIESAAVLTEEGYRIEASFKWTDIQPTAGTKVGFELQINDANASGKRSGTLSWADKTGNGYASPEVFGTILLTEGTPVAPTPETPEVKAELVTKWGVTYLVTEDGEKLTGFQVVDGDTYYFEPKKGAMQKSTWVTVEGKKYYAKKDGVIAKSEVVDKWTSKYIVDEEGVLQTGFFTFEGNDYYANEKGALQKSTWITSGNDKYYAKADYTLAKDETITKWGKKYTFDKDGKLVK